MLVDDCFCYAKTYQNQAADEERDDFQFLLLETLETEERNLGVQQIAAEQRQAN